MPKLVAALIGVWIGSVLAVAIAGVPVGFAINTGVALSAALLVGAYLVWRP